MEFLNAYGSVTNVKEIKSKRVKIAQEELFIYITIPTSDAHIQNCEKT